LPERSEQGMAPRHIARTLELSGSRRYEFTLRLSLRRESRRNQLKQQFLISFITSSSGGDVLLKQQFLISFIVSLSNNGQRIVR